MALHLADQHEAIPIWLIDVDDEQDWSLTLKHLDSFTQTARSHAAKARFQQSDQLLLIEWVRIGHQDQWQRRAHGFHSHLHRATPRL